MQDAILYGWKSSSCSACSHWVVAELEGPVLFLKRVENVLEEACDADGIFGASDG